VKSTESDEKNLLFENAAIVLYDRLKRILLQHRTDDAQYYPGYWAFFGGKIEPGETPKQAGRREAFEELSLDLGSPILLGEYVLKAYDFWYKLHVFVEEYSEDRSELVLGEGQGWGWFSALDLANVKTIPADQEVFSDLGVYIGWQKS